MAFSTAWKFGLAMPLLALTMSCSGQEAGLQDEAASETAVLRQASPLEPERAEYAAHATHDSPAERNLAAQPVGWHHGGRPSRRGSVSLKVLGINDFHGHLAEGSTVGGRPVGGAAVLTAYLRAAMDGIKDKTLIVHAGDQVGASPPESALLQDEPSIQFLNTLANRACRSRGERHLHCNLVGTLGNHEFDEGKDELLRLLDGGNYASGPFLQDPYSGAAFDYVNANVLVESTGRPLIAPYVIRELGGVRIGLIGAVLKETPTIVTPSGVAGLSFGDEADSINARVHQLRRKGVRAIIAVIHQGGFQSPSYTGPTDPGADVGSPIADIVSRLDDEVDLVIAGHTHAFTNALVPNAHGRPILVTQAYSYGTAYDDVDLEIDRQSGDVIGKSAKIVTTYSDVAPGDTRDPAVQAIVEAAVAKVAPLVNRPVATIDGDITRTQNAAGESALGDLIADAQRAAMGTDLAFMNPGGIRADLSFAANPTNPADTDGQVLWGELFTVQPFANSLVGIHLTGQQILDLLNQQWQPTVTRMLQVSGLSYTWDETLPVGSRITEVSIGGTPLALANLYSVAVNNFLAGGGDGFTVLTAGTEQVGGPIDLDALIGYLEAQPQPLSAPSLARISRVN